MSKDEKLMVSKSKSKDLAEKILIWQGDITKLEIDAIVNAINSARLYSDGGVGGIYEAGGPNLKEECMLIEDWDVGVVHKTAGHNLPVKNVFHTVAPADLDPILLRQCYENSLSLAMINNLRTIAFPCMYQEVSMRKVPLRPAAKIALTTVCDFLLKHPDAFDNVVFCVLLKTEKVMYEELLQEYIGP